VRNALLICERAGTAPIVDSATGKAASAGGLSVPMTGLGSMCNAMSYEGARNMEVKPGIALRELGYGVWQAQVCRISPWGKDPHRSPRFSL
jgi:hypothetical protein